MKAGELIRFIETGILGLITEIDDVYRVKVYSTYEDEETGEVVQVDQWFPRHYLLKCAEPAENRIIL